MNRMTEGETMAKRAKRITDQQVEAILGRFLVAWTSRKGGDVETFAEAGLLTSDRGLVLTLPNGQEFQVSIVESGRRQAAQ